MKVLPGWLELNVKVGCLSFVTPVGPDVMVVSGTPSPPAGTTEVKNATRTVAHAMPIRALTQANLADLRPYRARGGARAASWPLKRGIREYCRARRAPGRRRVVPGNRGAALGAGAAHRADRVRRRAACFHGHGRNPAAAGAGHRLGLRGARRCFDRSLLARDPPARP